ncbi:MAG: ABC transporter permease [bacterium]|jgi:ABC-type antimicrobial peptide transport system permease subunit|nr:ABC transporter permease [bacterium]
MGLLLRTHLSIALDSLHRNRARTFLSALGIAIGVASIVLIMSLTGGIGSLISASSDKNNANLILVRPSTGKELAENLIDELTANNQYAKSSLTLDDTTSIAKLGNIEAVAPIASNISAVTIGDKSYQSINVVATNADLVKTAKLALKNGQFFEESGTHNNAAVIGHDLATKLFGTTDILARTFQYGDQKFIIIGVLEKTDSPINYNGVDFDNSILIDINFANSFESSIQIQQINVRTTTTDSTESVAEEIKTKLTNSKKGDTTFQVLTGSSNFQPAGSLLSIISSMLTLVASISLVVGGVGIMNIMLVSVSERTREIGIRKAVGASSGNILLQFLFESIILSFIGGIMGIALGYATAFAISLITPFAPHISWSILGITCLTSLIVGIIFGVYPAAKAATKDPITSLKVYR